MVEPNESEEIKNKLLVHGIKLSSVVPGKEVGKNKTHELKPIDLAMKLHYLKGLYFFPNNKNNESLITIGDLKRPMFDWLVSYFITCGRVRLGSGPEGRPIIKLNDAGIRIIEALSDKTVDEWLALDGFLSLQDHLVYGHALGPDLGFSPLVFIQVTWFKCGGISVGLSWAHILGDVFSASTFINMLGQCIKGQKAQILTYPDHPKPEYPLQSPTQDPHSLKRVDPVGDHWVVPTNCKMDIHSFTISPTQLAKLLSKVHGTKSYEQNVGKYFEVISAIMWKTIAKVRMDLDPKVVTICRPKSLDRGNVIPYNGQSISRVTVDFSVLKVDILELISVITEKSVEENELVEEAVNIDKGKFDYVVYGANLTFVDMEDVDIYGFEIEGQHPIFASYTVGGVGEGGVIQVLPGVRDGKNGDNSGIVIIVTLPEYELKGVKRELETKWSIV